MKKLITTCVAAAVVLTTNSMAFDFGSAPAKISAHYVAAAQGLDAVKSKLTANGFEILATTSIIGGHDVITITNAELQATNTYMATLQVSVSGSEVRVQNPSYLGAAYLGDGYSYGQFKATVNSLEKALGSLSGSAQKTDFSDLGSYRFMFGMPKLADTITVKEGTGLAAKAKANTKNVAYTLALPNGVTLVGHKLRGKTNKFLKTLGQEKNAQLLPYESMVFANAAQILDPKYYLALSLPLLSMGEFMEIASVPDQIEKDIKRAYK
jgi:hypothetical protein